jgi:1-acyl-sn-glycerol-3-phosphate acyltransferase
MIRSSLLVLVNLVLMFVSIPVLLFCVLFGLRDTFGAYGRWLMRVDRWVLGIHVAADGLEWLDADTPYVFMLNHTSFLDGPLLVTVLDRPLRALVKRFVLRVPVLGLGMRWMGYIPLDREGVGEGKTRIARAAALVKEKRYSFLIFPEGTRSWRGDLLPFRRGGFFLALEAGIPIVPVTTGGAYELMPRGQRYVRKGTVRIVFHEPVPVTGYTAETLPELMERVRRAIASGLSLGRGL